MDQGRSMVGAALEIPAMNRVLVALGLAASLMSPTSSRLLDPLMVFLSSFSEGSAITKNGCGMDPFGRCNSAQPQQSENGCGMDPDGRCNSARP